MNRKNVPGAWSWPRFASRSPTHGIHRSCAVAGPPPECYCSGIRHDRAHIAILLTQIGPGYILAVDAIQNDNDPVNPTIIGSRLANAEQTVRRKDAATLPQGVQGSSTTTSINTVQKTAKKCSYCKKRGHPVAQCWKKQRGLQPHRDHALKADEVFPAHKETSFMPYHQARWKNGRARRLPRGRGSIS
jgi:hypothetical protein